MLNKRNPGISMGKGKGGALCVVKIPSHMFHTTQTVVCSRSDRMDWGTGQADPETLFVRTLGGFPSLLGIIDVAVSIMYT
jgi:hypothetical protein